jgi:tetratricopeptide (TPR) repeat protein
MLCHSRQSDHPGHTCTSYWWAGRTTRGGSIDRALARKIGSVGCLVLLALALAVPVSAQEARWNELNAQVVQLLQQGKYAEAIPLAQESLRVAEATFGAQHPNVATSLDNLAELYRKQGRHSDAEPLYQRALDIDEKALGPEHPDVGTDLNNLAELYRAQGRYADAEPLYQRALALDEKALGPEHPNVAIDLNNLAALYDDQGHYADAEPLYKRALAILEKALGPDHPNVATSLNNLAALYKEQGRYADAEPFIERALAIDEKALGPEHPDVGTDLNNLAELYREQEHYADAEPLYQRALALDEKALGPEHPNVAMDLNNLAALYDDQGRYAEAEPLYQRALAIREKALGPGHPDVASSLNNLAFLYYKQGRYAEAEPLFKRALAIDEKALEPEHPYIATDLNNLAGLYKKQGRYADAEPLYQRALATREKALGPGHPDVAQSLNNLAGLYADQGRYADAEPLYKRALAIREKALGPGHPDVANSLNNLAALYADQGRYADAEPLFKRALAIFEKALGPEHPDVATSLNNLAGFFYAWAQPAQAVPFFNRAFETLAKQFQYYFTYMSEKERLAFLATVQDRFPTYFSFCFTYRQQVPGLAGKMYDTVLWQKGFIAQSVAALRAKIIASGDAEALRLLDELAAKKGELAKLVTAPSEPEAQKQAARLAQIEQLEKEANELEKELVKRSGALAEEKRLAHVTWQQVRDALKPDEAAVEIVRFDFYDGKKWTGASEYVALIVRPESTQPQFVVLGEAKALEDDPLRDYRLRAGLSENRTIRGFEELGVESEANAAAPTTSFYQAFWKPLEPVLGSARRVYVSTDGVLNQVALGVVPDNAGQLLMEKYDLRIVSSTKDVLRQRRASTCNAAVVMGNPLFDLDEAQQRLAVRALQKTEQTEKTEKAKDAATAKAVAVPSAKQRSRDLRGGKLNPLPGTQKEAETVSKLLKEQHWDVGLYTQEKALEERVKGVQSPRVLHLATHGFFESDQERKQKDLAVGLGEERASGLEDPMLRSGLYLTGANRTLEGRATPADMDDGVLTAYEATQLNLQGTELVVLSACETGLGESQNGEGVFGLRRALQEAGAESVLMSMWSVPDQETQELMTLFYQKWLGGKDKHEALREAQSELRATVKARYGRDLVYYWGAFVLVGR